MTTAETAAARFDPTAVIVTDELFARPRRETDPSALLEQIVALVRCLAEHPDQLPQMLVEAVHRFTRAGSAGLSLEDVGGSEPVFRWIALSGRFADYLGGTMPRYFSPCGTVVDADQPMLMRDAVKCYPYIEGLHSPAHEILLVPFRVSGKAIGTLWAVSHETGAHFNADDLEAIEQLCAVAGAGIQTSRTIDALKEAERHISTLLSRSQEAAKSLRTWFDQAPGFVALLTGPEHVFEVANEAYYQIVGRRDLIGKTLAQGFPEAHAQGFGDILGQVLRTGEPFIGRDVRIAVQRAAGADLVESWVDFVYQPIRDDDGVVVGILAQGHDVTAQHLAVQQLLDADRRKDEFVATLAHELRNPLAPIRQASRIMRAPSATPSQKNWSLDVIERQTNTLALLLDDLLDVSQVSRGRIELRHQVVSVGSLIDAAVETARPALESRKHRLHVESPADDLVVNGDPLRLTQVLTNLLTNAAKYTDVGGDVWVRAFVEAGSVAVSVRDSGIGLDSSAISSVFDMFTQLSAAGTRTKGGLGIGLALSRGLVDLHGGTIEARSDGLGKGSEFIVCIPMAAEVATNADALSTIRPAPAAARLVLLADDDRDAADTLAMLLTMEGFRVNIAKNGREAVDMAARRLPDICILDIGMPVVDGYEAARRIRALPSGDRPILIALTGWGDPVATESAVEAGFDHHCTKPIGIEALMHLMHRHEVGEQARALGGIANEMARLAELRRLDILDTEAEAVYDEITLLASEMAGAPIALISLIDDSRQWFKSRRGLEATETSREAAFCHFAIQSPDQVMTVHDTLQDARFSTNPLVTGDPNIRFYAGAPIVTASGHALGTVCVIDREPRELNAAQVETLKFLARRTAALLEARASGLP